MVCPIITAEKLTQPSVSENYSFVCFAVSQSRNLMFFPLRLGSGLPALDQYFLWLKVVTSGWPSALHMTFLTPAVSRCWSKALFAYSWQPTLTCKAALFKCNTGACLFYMSWVDSFLSVIHFLFSFFLSLFMKLDFFPVSSPPALLTRWTLNSYSWFFSHTFFTECFSSIFSKTVAWCLLPQI